MRNVKLEHIQAHAQHTHVAQYVCLSETGCELDSIQFKVYHKALSSTQQLECKLNVV